MKPPDETPVSHEGQILGGPLLCPSCAYWLGQKQDGGTGLLAPWEIRDILSHEEGGPSETAGAQGRGKDLLKKNFLYAGHQCLKFLWLNRRQPEVRTEPTSDLVARKEAGTEVGLYAQQLFPSEMEITFDGHTKEEELKTYWDLLALAFEK